MVRPTRPSRPTRLDRSDARVSTSVAALLCDLDGVVYRGAQACPGAVDGLRRARVRDVRILFLTNNAGHTPADVVERLTSLGVQASEEEVLTSSMVAARWLREQSANLLAPEARTQGRGGPLVLAVGGPGVGLALRDQGFDVCTPADVREAARPGGSPLRVAAVVQGYGPAVTARDLAEATFAVADGALWVATNTDATLPSERGLAPGNGSLVRAVAHALGREPDAVVGKPHPPAYAAAAALLHCAPEQVMAIGDRLDTDIQGARAAGMQTTLVLTGVATRREGEEAPAQARPDLIVPTLGDLAQVLWPG